MNVLYFGTYDRSSPRNTQVISCLEAAGVTVSERHRQVWGRSNWSLGLRQLARVAAAERGLARERELEQQADVVVVGYPGHFDMPAARRVARGRPIVFNPLVSLHDTLVGDRGRFRRGTPAAAVLRHADRAAFRRADLVVADTAAHAAFFQEAFELPDERLAVVFVGAEDRLFRPGWQPERPFYALFVGKLIPLHGLETILEAARLAPEVPFRVIGSGQLEGMLGGRPENVQWVPWVEYELLPAEYQAAGCALGIFGTGAKAARVIPNKAFQALACRCPLVTADTPGARELLTDGVDALLVPPGDPEALAQAVRRLAGDAALAEGLAAGGRATYEARASEAVLGAQWRALLEQVVAAR
ncbi:MAG: glycosyltransferase family 4 protein [Thermoleophilia bacterium]|nr:glycosyltransferase family 4 protein [Thermoleophilia bacterium]MDH5334654.1 glycosyltransferase family 4 protein [Thermoleophilia bacterium]